MEIDFPIILVFDVGGAIAEARNDFVSVSDESLVAWRHKAGWTVYRDPLVIVDSSGHCFRVTKVDKVRAPKGGLWEFLKRINSAKTEILIGLRPAEAVSLEDLKQILIASWERGKPGYWEECVGDIDLYTKGIQQSKSFREIIEITLDPWNQLGLLEQEEG